MFHNVRPTNPAILHGFNQFARLRRELPDTVVVLVAGNHDTPRAAETGCILRLFAPLGIHVVDRTPQRLSFPERDLSVLAVPDVAGLRPSLAPDSATQFNVLLLHGEVEGMLPPHLSAIDRVAVGITRDELGATRWNYVALGHYHVYRQIAPNAFYSGSIDYTSANTWGELVEEREAGVPGKGMIEYDLVTNAHTFHPLPKSRRLVDLAGISARGLSVADVDARIRHSVDECAGGIEDAVVRLVVRDLPRHVARELDHKALRDYKRRALHFHLDSRRPEIIRAHGSGAPGRRPSLAEVVRDKLQSRSIEGDIERSELVEMGLRYLREAESTGGGPSAVLEG